MRVTDLFDGQIVRVRTGRYRADLTEPAWSPWRTAALYVARDAGGHVCTIGLSGANWAEYDPRHDPPVDGVLLCEDYYLQIEGLEP